MCLFTDLKAHLLSIRSWGCLLALLSYSEGLRHLRLAGYICWWHPRHCLQYRRDAFSASQQSTCLANYSPYCMRHNAPAGLLIGARSLCTAELPLHGATAVSGGAGPVQGAHRLDSRRILDHTARL